MISMIVSALLLCTGVVIITQGIDVLHSIKIKDLNIRLFFYLCFSGMLSNFCYSGLAVMHSGLAYECLGALAWCSCVAFMGIVVCLLAYLLDTDQEKTRMYTSIILYSGIILFIVDILIRGGMEHVVLFPVEEDRQLMARAVLLCALCLLSFYFMISMLYSYHKRTRRKRERVIFRQIMAICAIIAGGITIEAVLHFTSLPNIPFYTLSMVFVTWCMKQAYQCHETLEIRREDYEEVLESNNHEPVVICDDEGKVVFINKCAVISIVDEKEPVIGKRLDELFELHGSEWYSAPRTGMFTISGVFRTTGRRCNLTIQNVYDTYGEVMTNIITVYRLEYANVYDSNVSAAKESQQTVVDPAEVVDVTSGASILLVDDSPSALALLEGAMKPYEMQIERAFSGKEAIELLTGGKRYDMLFIDHMMPEMDGIETAKQIRGLEGDYFNIVPIVFCSATNIEENLSDFLKVRFNDFLSKPVSIKELSDILTRWLWNRVTAEGQTVEEEAEENLHMSARIEIPGIEKNIAAKYIGDNKAMYLTLLKTFSGDMGDMLADLEKSYEHYDRMRFRILVHAMYSSCKGIGAIDLSERADKLEQACIREDSQYIADHIKQYLKDFKEILNHIDEYLKTSAR